MHRFAGLAPVLATAVAASSAIVIVSAGSAFAAGCEPWYGAQPTGVDSIAHGVAALSRCNAWLVGTDASSGPLAEQWNGNRWTSKMVPTPASVDSAAFYSLSAVGPADMWAVGVSVTGNTFSAFAEHSNGSSWSIVPTPNPGTSGNSLLSVFARSSGDAWAVGTRTDASMSTPLIERWDGLKWAVSPSPQLPARSTSGSLSGITAIGPNNAWAVGSYYKDNSARTLVVHWNGSSWNRVASPNPGGTGNNTANFLYSVTATSKGNVWAVGSWFDGAQPKYRTLVLRWNGSQWSVQPSPSSALFTNTLLSVSAASATSAWAVGFRVARINSVDQNRRTLILHWDGAHWSLVRSPEPSGSDQYSELNAADVMDTGNVWAVGDFYNGSHSQPLAVHCC